MTEQSPPPPDDIQFSAAVPDDDGGLDSDAVAKADLGMPSSKGLITSADVPKAGGAEPLAPPFRSAADTFADNNLDASTRPNPALHAAEGVTPADDGLDGEGQDAVLRSSVTEPQPALDEANIPTHPRAEVERLRSTMGQAPNTADWLQSPDVAAKVEAQKAQDAGSAASPNGDWMNQAHIHEAVDANNAGDLDEAAAAKRVLGVEPQPYVDNETVDLFNIVDQKPTQAEPLAVPEPEPVPETQPAEAPVSSEVVDGAEVEPKTEMKLSVDSVNRIRSLTDQINKARASGATDEQVSELGQSVAYNLVTRAHNLRAKDPGEGEALTLLARGFGGGVGTPADSEQQPLKQLLNGKELSNESKTLLEDIARKLTNLKGNRPTMSPNDFNDQITETLRAAFDTVESEPESANLDKDKLEMVFTGIALGVSRQPAQRKQLLNDLEAQARRR